MIVLKGISKALFTGLALVSAGLAHAANGAAFISQTVPAAMVPGQTYAVSVTMQNTGTTTWTTATAHRLGSLNPMDNTTWGTNRIALPGGSSVGPGANATFIFNVTAPNTPGTYNFQWNMVQDGVQWFGAASQNVAVKVGINDAAFVSQNVPSGMVPGQTYPVSITVQNSGGRTWSAATNHRLGSVNPPGTTIWGINKVWLPTGTTVAPGESYTFNFNVTAPGTTGEYNFQWRMGEDGVEWFGASSPNVVVRNGLNHAEFVSQVVPPVMTPGASHAVSITMKNSGGTTWSAAQNHRLGRTSTNWTPGRIMLPDTVTVPPGANHTFTFDVTAPATPGTYDFKWQMVEEFVEWFGAFSANVPVRVGLDDAEFLSQSVPAIMTPGQTYNVSVIMRNTGNATWRTDKVWLGSQNAADNTIWGFNRVPLPNDVVPGGTVTLDFAVTAPSTPGTYNFQWRMVDGPIGWFGQSTANVAVQNGLDNAQFVAQSVPVNMVPGQTYPVSVTMQNTGSTTWSAGAGYRLGSQNAQDNSIWGLSRVDLPGPVAPGQNATFTFDVVAPTAAGPYNFQWRLLQGASDWFGGASSNLAVNVGTGQSNVYFIQTDHLNTPRLVANAAGQTVWRHDNAEPFGTNPPDENPGGLGAFEFPLRFPGQYFDKETGLHQNGFRDYWSDGGRYIESDPIGLLGGINTYAYVESKPLWLIDPDGLQAAPYEPPPPNIPGGPWKWSPDSSNSRGGSYTGQGNSSASWDSKGNHWDVDDGKGNRQRYNRWGKPVTPQQAHSYKGPKQRPLRFPRGPSFLMCIPLYFSYCDQNPGDPACTLGKDFCDSNPDLCA